MKHIKKFNDKKYVKLINADDNIYYIDQSGNKFAWLINYETNIQIGWTSFDDIRPLNKEEKKHLEVLKNAKKYNI